MRIAHVTATFPPYSAGTGQVAYHNASVLARRGHQVTVFTAAHPAGQFDYPEEFTVKRLPAALRIGNAPLLPGLLRLRDFDIVHLHHPFIFGAELIWAVSKMRRIPYVLTHHNDLIGNGQRRHLFGAYSVVSTHLAVKGAAKFAVVSLDHAAECRLAKIFRKRWHDVVEIPNGVDTHVFQPNEGGKTVRADYGISRSADLILFVGALDRAHHFKGVDYLIETFSQIRDRDTHLMIVGDGDMKSHFVKVAKESGVAQRVVFVGSIPNRQLRPYYSAADLVVLPSFPPESFGIVILEAMACGRPVVAHNIPGVRTVISEGEDGFLAVPGDMDDLADKILTLLNDPGLRMAMGRRGRAKVQEQYAWERIGEELEALYNEVLASE